MLIDKSSRDSFHDINSTSSELNINMNITTLLSVNTKDLRADINKLPVSGSGNFQTKIVIYNTIKVCFVSSEQRFWDRKKLHALFELKIVQAIEIDFI